MSENCTKKVYKNGSGKISQNFAKLNYLLKFCEIRTYKLREIRTYKFREIRTYKFREISRN